MGEVTGSCNFSPNYSLSPTTELNARNKYETLKLPIQTSLHNISCFSSLPLKIQRNACDMLYTEERAELTLIYPHLKSLQGSVSSKLKYRTKVLSPMS